MKNRNIEPNIIISINAMKSIMGLFLGPFLTAYFIKTSKESLVDLSIYYITSHIILVIGSFIVAHIVKKKFRIGMFRIGVILNFFYIMTIIILKENIINHLLLVSIIYGVSASAYWFPYNLFVTNKVNNEDRTAYTVRSKTVSAIISISCPILLGSLITITNYELTAILILFISFIQIFLSFLLIPEEREENLDDYNLMKAWKDLKSDKNIRNLSKVEFLSGLNVSDAALEILITILIFSSFKTNLNLGLINSATAILSMGCVNLYGKIYKTREDKRLLVFASVLPVISIFTLLIWKNNITIILYNICYVILTAILTVTREIRLFNISDSIVSRNNQCEFFAIRELILNLGRILGYIMLLISGLTQNENFLNITMILLSLSILMMGLNIKKLGKFENRRKNVNYRSKEFNKSL